MAHAAPNSSRSRIPHPILKRDISPFRAPTLPFSRTSGGGPSFSPHVHFPPTPGMSSTYPAYSPTTYDRKPIVISPNVVQLPRRGERRLSIPSPDSEEPAERRGRRRSRSRGRERGARARSDEGLVKGSYFHPRAYEACVPEAADDPTTPPIDFNPPPLIHDLSPSDESDDLVMTPPQAGAGLSGFAPASRSMPLQLPGSAKERRHSVAKAQGADSQPSATLPLVSPQPTLYHAKGHRRSNSARVGRRERERGTFSPDLDEGCLGGF
ncbi:hypothetical protein V8D89_006472 [Ganoderma adspersum]